MSIVSGRCTLIIDGQPHLGVSFALELVKDPRRKGFGFLSGPVGVLKSTRLAKQLQIKLDSGEILPIKVLALSLVDLPVVLIGHNATQRNDNDLPHGGDRLLQELSTIDKLRALIEDHLKAEGFLNTSVTVQADLDKTRGGKWGVKDFVGDDNEADVKNALNRLIPELQKRFRL
jgi:hypothetical protein